MNTVIHFVKIVKCNVVYAYYSQSVYNSKCVCNELHTNGINAVRVVFGLGRAVNQRQYK